MLKSQRIAALMNTLNAANERVCAARTVAFGKVSVHDRGHQVLDATLCRLNPDAAREYSYLTQAHTVLVYAMRDLQRKSITNIQIDQIISRTAQYVTIS